MEYWVGNGLRYSVQKVGFVYQDQIVTLKDYSVLDLCFFLFSIELLEKSIEKYLENKPALI